MGYTIESSAESSATACEGILATLGIQNSSSVPPSTDIYSAHQAEGFSASDYRFALRALADANTQLPLTSYICPFSGGPESLTVDPHLMVVNKPYPFEFEDWWFVAVKNTDGDVNFYYIEAEGDVDT